MKIFEIVSFNSLNVIVENAGCWSDELTAKQILAEIGITQPNSSTQPSRQETVFRRCDSYKQTYLQKVKPYPSIRRKFADFMELKRWDPIQAFGKSDKLFIHHGRYIQAVPNLKHAHITFDLSIVYKLSGNTMWLYGFYTHDELGTGQPANIRIQDAMAKKIANKTEADCPTSVKRPQPRYK